MSSKYSQEQKLAAVQAYIRGEGGIRQIARDYQVSRGALIQWVAYYKKNGCLPDTTPKTTPSPHPLQFKLEVLYWQQLHDASDLKTAVTFKLRGMEIVSKWRKQYLQGGKFRLIRDRDGKVKLMEKKKLVVHSEPPVKVRKEENLPRES
ncbi:MAG: transposase [Treponema sp.]|nr:transposase [Treponema sp.]